MIRITEIDTIVKNVVFSGEVLINLSDFINILESDMGKQIEMGECLITPYYVQDNKRMELYQYEFCVSDEYDYDDYILQLTGKENIEDIPEKVVRLRKICFAEVKESDKLLEYLKFLFANYELKKEVEQVFSSFNEKNLYATIY